MIPFGLTAVASAADRGTHKEVLSLRSPVDLAYGHRPQIGNQATTIISSVKMENTLKIVQSLEYSGLLTKGIT